MAFLPFLVCIVKVSWLKKGLRNQPHRSKSAYNFRFKFVLGSRLTHARISSGGGNALNTDSTYLSNLRDTQSNVHISPARVCCCITFFISSMASCLLELSIWLIWSSTHVLFYISFTVTFSSKVRYTYLSAGGKSMTLKSSWQVVWITRWRVRGGGHARLEVLLSRCDLCKFRSHIYFRPVQNCEKELTEKLAT